MHHRHPSEGENEMSENNCTCLVTPHGRITPRVKILACPTHGYEKRQFKTVRSKSEALTNRPVESAPAPEAEGIRLSWEYIGEELAVFWQSPYGHGKEKIATFWWPAHPV